MSDEILKKIQALMGMAKSGTENEAAMAMALVQKLMQKHSITEQMLASGSETLTAEEIKSWEDPLYTGGKNRSQWRGALAYVICKYHNCEGWTSGGNINIIGRASDVQTVRYLFNYCETYISLFSQQYAGNGKGWLNQYKLGVVKAISDKLEQARKEARAELIKEYGDSAKNAIIKVDENALAVKRFYDKFSVSRNLKQSTFGAQSSDENARNVGYKDGQAIQMGSGNKIGSGTKGLPSKSS
jgi:hypothetical protein